MKWKKDDIRCEYRPFSILSFYSFYFILSTLFASSSASQFLFQLSTFNFQLSTKLQIALSVWKHIIHTCFENIGNLIDFKE